MEEIFLKTSDNIKIAINHYKKGHNEVLILAPGWFMTKDSKSFSQIAEVFNEDTDVITMDFRGHGKSSGFYTFTTKEIVDLETVVNYAKNQYQKINLMGFSLGGGLVLIHGALNKNIDKIIAVSAPSSFDKIENHVWKKEAWLPTLQKFELKRWISIRPSFVIREKIKPIDVVGQIDVPVLFIAGEKDPTVYAWHTKELYEKATCDKHFELFEKCYHAEDLFIQSKEKFIDICKNWLEKDFKIDLIKA